MKMDSSIKEAVIDNGGSYETKADILGQKHYCLYRPVADNDGNVIGAYFTGVSAESADNMFRRSIILSVVLGVIVCAVIIFTIIVFTNKNIIKPVVSAKLLSDEMSRGNLNYSDFGESFPDNEVGDLVNTLEKTKHRLALYVHDMTEVMKSMADGDFTHIPSVEYAGDFAAISEAIFGIDFLTEIDFLTLSWYNRIY